MAARRRRQVKRFRSGHREFAWVGDAGFIEDIDSTFVGQTSIIAPADLTGSASKRSVILRKIIGTVAIFPSLIPVANESFIWYAGIVTHNDGDPTPDDPASPGALTEEIWHWTAHGAVLVNAAVLWGADPQRVDVRPNRRITTDNTVDLAITGDLTVLEDGAFTAAWQLRCLLEF